MKKKILYFVKGRIEPHHKALADGVGAVIRSADACRPGDFIEQCDGVFGEVPTAYDKFDRVEMPVPADPAASTEMVVETEPSSGAPETGDSAPAASKSKKPQRG